MFRKPLVVVIAVLYSAVSIEIVYSKSDPEVVTHSMRMSQAIKVLFEQAADITTTITKEKFEINDETDLPELNSAAHFVQVDGGAKSRLDWQEEVVVAIPGTEVHTTTQTTAFLRNGDTTHVWQVPSRNLQIFKSDHLGSLDAKYRSLEREMKNTLSAWTLDGEGPLAKWAANPEASAIEVTIEQSQNSENGQMDAILVAMKAKASGESPLPRASWVIAPSLGYSVLSMEIYDSAGNLAQRILCSGFVPMAELPTGYYPQTITREEFRGGDLVRKVTHHITELSVGNPQPASFWEPATLATDEEAFSIVDRRQNPPVVMKKPQAPQEELVK